MEKADIEKPSIERDGRRHYWKYKGPQEYQCLFGKIEVTRSVYQANGEWTMCPLEVDPIHGLNFLFLGGPPPPPPYPACGPGLLVLGCQVPSC